MPVPNKIELFQSFCRKYVNRKVKEFFKDRGDEIEENFAEIFNKNNLKHIVKGLCLHDDNDSVQWTIFAFNFFFQYVNPTPIELDEILLGIPKEDYDERVQYQPQLFLYFTQDYQERDQAKAKGAKSPVRMEMSCRLVEKNIEKYGIKNDPKDNQLLKNLAKEIKSNFQGYQYEKGIYRASYRDAKNGLRLTVPYRRESDCKDLIRRFLSSLSLTPDYEQFFKPDSREGKTLGKFEQTGKVKTQYADKELMLGERKNKLKDRAIGTVFLHHAVLQVHQREPVMLCHYRRGKGIVDL